jgi:hypothetical protein
LADITLDLATTAEPLSVMDIDSQDVRMRGLNDYEENDDESFDRDLSKIQRRHMNDEDDDDEDDDDDDAEEDINGDRTHSRKSKVRTVWPVATYWRLM